MHEMQSYLVFACTDGGLAGELLQDYSRITRVNNITNPSQCRPAKTIKRDWLPEKIIGCHSEKIVKTSYGIKNLCFRDSLLLTAMYFSVSFFLFSLSTPSTFKSLSSMALHLSSFTCPPSLTLRNEFAKPFQGIKIPLQPTLTLRLPLYLSSLEPHCSYYCISRHSTCYLIGGREKLN